MGDKIELIHILNPIDKVAREIELVPYDSEKTLWGYRKDHLPVEIDFDLSVSGKFIPKEKWGEIVLRPTDQIVAVPKVEDAQTIVGIATLVAVAVALILSPFTGGASLGAIPWILAIGAGLQMAIALLFPPSIPTPTLPDSTQVYNWQPQTLQRPGVPVPRIYGRMKVFGNIIDAYRYAIGSAAGDQRYMNVLICLGMGPIESISSVKLNDQNISTLPSCSYTQTLGFIRQNGMPGFVGTFVEHPYAQEVKYSDSPQWTVQTDGELADSICVTLEFPQGVWFQNDDGYDLHGVYYSVWAWIDGQPPALIAQDNVVACRVTNIIRDYRFTTTDLHGKGRYNISVHKDSPDRINGPEASYGDQMYCTGVTEYIHKAFTYPRHALVSINALASSALAGSFRFSCIVQGLKVLVYYGGTWHVQYSSNPAWIAFDILCQPVYDNNFGVLRYDGVPRDTLSIYLQDWVDFAEHCDQIVADGTKRAEFNAIFDGLTNAFDAAQQVCAVGRGFLLPVGTSYRVIIDRAKNRTQLFNKADMRPDSYQCTWLALQDRVSQIEGSNFIDSANDEYQQVPIALYSKEIRNKTAIQTVDLKGTTTRTQALRILKYYLNYNERLLRVHSFKVDSEAIVSDIGDRVDIQDETMSSYSDSGRVVSGTSTTVTLDKEVTVVGGTSYLVSIRHADDSLEDKTVVPAYSYTYTTNVLTVSTAFTQTPGSIDATWTFGESATYVKPIIITDKETNEDTRETTITGIDYNASIYSASDDFSSGTLPTVPTIITDTLPAVQKIVKDSDGFIIKPYPVGIRLAELYNKSEDIGYMDYVDVYWENPDSTYYAGVEIWYKTPPLPAEGDLPAAETTSWTYAGFADAPATSYRVYVTTLGLYTFAACTRNTLGQKMDIVAAPQAVIDVVGYLRVGPILPVNVTNFFGSAQGGGLLLTWSKITGQNIDYFRIRYNKETDISLRSAKWENSVEIATVYGTSLSIPAAADGIYWIKAVNDWGNESDEATGYVAILPPMSQWFTVTTQVEDPGFAGTKTNTHLEGSLLYPDTGFTSGAYYDSDAYSLPSIQNARVQIVCKWFGDTTVNGEGYVAWDSIPNFDSWNDISPTLAGPTVKFYINISQNDTTWGGWQPIAIVGDFTGKAFKIRVELSTTIADQVAFLEELSWVITVPTRNEQGEDVSINSGGTDINFTKSYLAKPKVVVSQQSAALGDYAIVTVNQSGDLYTGIHVHLYDSSNTPKSGSVDWFSTGF